MTWNPLNWFGRGSVTDRLVRALPNPDRIVRNGRAWKETLAQVASGALVALDYGTRMAYRVGMSIEQWEASESELLDALRSAADALDVAGGFVSAQNREKLAPLANSLRGVAATIGLADDAFDAWFQSKGRVVLERYLEARR